MVQDYDWFSILCCPATKQSLSVADDSMVKLLNQAVSRGILANVGQRLVSDHLEGGLIRADRKILYPIRENIPVLLVEEGIPLDVLQ